jgi:ABC-type uncharacterized transport system auxiliary subunit
MLLRTAPAFVAILFAASCASIPSTNHYVLGLPRESDVATGKSKYTYSVAIAPFESEPVYMRKKIIWRSHSTRLGYYSYEKWASLPSEMLALRLYERCHSAGLFKTVYAEGSGAADLVISGKVIAFEELESEDGHFGRVEAMIQIAERDGESIWSGVVSHAEPVGERNIRTVVQAIADATDEVLTQAIESMDSSLEERMRQEELARKMGAHYFSP